MFDMARIEKARIIRAMSKKELAEAAGVRPYTYTRILQGESKNPKTVKAICDVLGLAMEEVYVGSENDRGSERVA